MCYHYFNMLLQKPNIIRVVLLFLLIIAVADVYYQNLYMHVPSNWSVYVNTQNHYSFAYPAEWSLTECGNGEVVVSIKPVQKCYYPIDAPKDYLENLHIQTFLPRKNFVLYPSLSQQERLSEKLKMWQAVLWEEREDVPSFGFAHDLFSPRQIWTKTILVDANATTSAEMSANIVTLEQGRTTLYPNTQFYIGFVSNPVYNKTYQKVLQSAEFHYY